MSHLMIAFLIVCAFLLISGSVMALRSLLRGRAEEMTPFRDYFGREHDRDPLRKSSWRVGDNPYGLPTRFTFNIRDLGLTRRPLRGNRTTRRNRNRD